MNNAKRIQMGNLNTDRSIWLDGIQISDGKIPPTQLHPLKILHHFHSKAEGSFPSPGIISFFSNNFLHSYCSAGFHGF